MTRKQKRDNLVIQMQSGAYNMASPLVKAACFLNMYYARPMTIKWIADEIVVSGPHVVNIAMARGYNADKNYDFKIKGLPISKPVQLNG